MSAIYGMIDLKERGIAQDMAERFHHSYQHCAIDRYEHKTAHHAMFGCGIQYFTKEARQEILPIVDEAHHLMFTADCVVDNRDGLIRELGITDTNVPDGTILYQAYLKWGKQCIKYVRGAFSFVVYDWEKKEVQLHADHFANRCLFYHLRGGVLYFSTLLFPLAQASGLQYQENERWLVDCISLRGPAMLIETRECALKDVYKVDAGNRVCVTAAGAKYETYWNPVQTIQTDKTITAQECEKLVRTCLKKSVAEMIRTDGEVGIQLSSGLDSTTIAGFAAPLLEKQGKKLYSYTSVPVKEQEQKGYFVDDETEGVLKMCQCYPNIEPSFLKCEGKNILTEAEHILDVWEMPCKSEQNAVWVDAIISTAAENGCKIMLTGATGNCTVSAGGLENYLADLIKHFHWMKAYKSFKHFAAKYGINKKKFTKVIVTQLWEYHTRYFDKEQMNCYKNIITRREMGEKYHITKRYNKDILHFSPIKSLKVMRGEIFLPKAYAQIGELDTKHSLAYGVLVRDPLRNVHFIELCMKLPMECYVNENYDRRLVREFMHDIVPEEIRLDIRHRGRQSGDNAYRISKSWNQYVNKIRDSLLSEETTKYLDPALIEEYISGLREDNLEDETVNMCMILDAYMMSLYLKRLKRYE